VPVLQGGGLALDRSVVLGLAAPWGGYTSFSGCGPFGWSCHKKNLLVAAELGRFTLERLGEASLPGFVAHYFDVPPGLTYCWFGDSILCQTSSKLHNSLTLC
jgi:hypothetical protein